MVQDRQGRWIQSNIISYRTTYRTIHVSFYYATEYVIEMRVPWTPDLGTSLPVSILIGLCTGAAIVAAVIASLSIWLIRRRKIHELTSDGSWESSESNRNMKQHGTMQEQVIMDLPEDLSDPWLQEMI